MSVLVEALTVIVRRRTLDAMWPGATDAYLAAAVSEDSPTRLTCADDDITAISFLSSNDCQAWIDRLEHLGIIHLRNNRSADIVCIDQHRGPTSHCDWIKWRHHPEGFTYAWLAGTDPGDVVAPSTRRPTRAVSPSVVRDDSGRMIQLATEDGLEYWLDLETGQQIVGLVHQSEAPGRPPRRDVSPLMPLVLAAMERLEWTPESHDNEVLTIRIGGPRFVFTMLVFADDAARTLVCTGVLPILVDADRRRAVAEVVVRINRGLRLGTFDLDLGDGELRYRIGCDVEGGSLTEHMVMTMLGNVGASIERFGPALMQVVFGQASPEDAARAALGGDDTAED